ncbi:MAG: protein kinase [Planctomycetes bacterium]|nr:protein kinase [Planctomycetota bacterium]
MPSTGRPQIGGYEIYEELGRVAMGTVYLARQQLLNRLVALKVLRPSLMASVKARQRFLLEARALARLRHPHIVAVHDVVDTDEVCAYAMEVAHGRTLARLPDGLPRGRRASSTDLAAAFPEAAPDVFQRGAVVFLAQIGIAVGRALDAVHRCGIVHRDVKPSNILLCTDGLALLSDFGLSFDEVEHVQTVSGQFLGTPAFAAPEQLAGRNRVVDGCSDVCSLGVTPYQAFTGSLPHEAESSGELLRRVAEGLHAPPRRLAPWLPRDLGTIVETAMQPDPAARYASGGELADDLQRFLDLRPIHARRVGWVARAWELARRHRGIVAAAVLTLAAAAAFAVLLVEHLLGRAEDVDRVRAMLRQARAEWLTADPIALDRPPVVQVADRATSLYAAAGEPGPFERLGASEALRARRERSLIDGAREYVERGAVSAARARPLAAVSAQLAPFLEDWDTAAQVFGDPTCPADLWTQDDHLAVGLFAYLTGHPGAAARELGRLDRDLGQDFLIDSVLGRLRLWAGDRFLAVSHLRSAVESDARSLRNVFDCADALLAHDRGAATQLLHEFRGAAAGGLSDYDAAFFVELTSRNLAAIARYLRLGEREGWPPRVQYALVRAADRWWEERLGSLSAQLDGLLRVQSREAPASVLHRLRDPYENALASLRELPPARVRLASFPGALSRSRAWTPTERGLPLRERRASLRCELLADHAALRHAAVDGSDRCLDAAPDDVESDATIEPLAVLGAGGRAGAGFGRALDARGGLLAVGSHLGGFVAVYDPTRGPPATGLRIERSSGVDLYGGAVALLEADDPAAPVRLAVGAMHADGAAANAGAVEIVRLGTSAGGPLVELPDPLRITPAGLFPGASDANFGKRLCRCEDADDDGIDDVLVGADGLDGNRGAVAMISGCDGHALWTSEGVSRRHKVGHATHAIGDLDGDGCADVLVGCNEPQDALRNVLRQVVVARSGRDGRELWRVEEREQSSSLGVAAAMLAPGPSAAARLLLGAPSSGQAGGRVVCLTLAAEPPWGPRTEPDVIGGIGSEDGFGTGLVAVDDLDGDGHGDLLVIAKRDHRRAFPSLAITLVSGLDRARGRSVRVETSVTGAVAIAVVPDLDGDGLRDVALSADGADDFDANAGKVMLLPAAAWAGDRRAR